MEQSQLEKPIWKLLHKEGERPKITGIGYFYARPWMCARL